MSERPIAYYVTAHGYGHGSRSCDILGALKRLRPCGPVLVVSDLGEDFFRGRLAGSLAESDAFRQAAFDVGMVQVDSIRTDVDATLDRLLSLYARVGPLVRDEARFLEERGVAAVVADIPGIPLEAAARAGIPAIAVGNFSWDWIYAPFVARDRRWGMAVEHFRDAYARADLLLRLPFHGDMSAFRRIEDVPLLATAGRERRDEMARQLNADARKTWVLLSFTSLDWGRQALDRVNGLTGCEFLSVRPLEWPGSRVHTVAREDFSFQDILASADVVLSKPGFGIVSECIVNRKALIYADRTDFVEYPVLVEGIRKYLRNLHIPAARLYAGDLGESLEQIGRQPEPADSLPAGGAEIAARRILALAGSRPAGC